MHIHSTIYKCMQTRSSSLSHHVVVVGGEPPAGSSRLALLPLAQSPQCRGCLSPLRGQHTTSTSTRGGPIYLTRNTNSTCPRTWPPCRGIITFTAPPHRLPAGPTPSPRGAFARCHDLPRRANDSLLLLGRTHVERLLPRVRQIALQRDAILFTTAAFSELTIFPIMVILLSWLSAHGRRSFDTGTITVCRCPAYLESTSQNSTFLRQILPLRSAIRQGP